jgi:hypothetical protein
MLLLSLLFGRESSDPDVEALRLSIYLYSVIRKIRLSLIKVVGEIRYRD